MLPREVLDWDHYFLQIAFEVRSRSKDPSTQHGAVLVCKRRHIVATGYNGPPRLIDDRSVRWTRPDKYPFILHAEENAILNGLEARGLAGLAGGTLYVTGNPCPHCTLLAVRAELSRLVYGCQQSAMIGEEQWRIATEIARLGSLQLERLDVLTPSEAGHGESISAG